VLVAVVGGERCSSLYRLLGREDRAGGSSLRWRVSLRAVRRPGGSVAPSEPPPGRSAMATYRFRSGAMAQLWMSYDIPRPGLGSGLQLLLVGDEG
jgi:hypothetical protein